MEYYKFDRAFRGHIFVEFDKEHKYVVEWDEFKEIKKLLGKKFNKKLTWEEFQGARFLVRL